MSWHHLKAVSRGCSDSIRRLSKTIDQHGLCSDYFFLILLLLPWMLFQSIVTWWELQKKQKSNEYNMDCVQIIFLKSYCCYLEYYSITSFMAEETI